MLAVKTIDLTQNFRQIAENIFRHGERVLISRPHNENLVLITEREYNALERDRRSLAVINESVTRNEESDIDKRREMLKSITGIIKTDVDVKAMRAERIAGRRLLE